MSIPNLTKDLAVIQKLSDLPNSTDGLTAAQLKAKFDEAGLEIQKWLNSTFIPAIKAENLPFTGSEQLNANTVQDAIWLVFEQVRSASSGTIVNGSVTKEKLAAELLARVFGGRPWVSLDKPANTDTPEKEFPIGQTWLCPGVTVTNAAGTNWIASGCTTEAKEHAVTVTGDSTIAETHVTMNLSNIGQNGDRVYVLFGIKDQDAEITSLTVSLSGGEEESASSAVHKAMLSGGALSVRFRAVWPSTSLAKGSYTIENFAVVNIDQILRQTTDCREMTDWGSYLQSLLPLGSHYEPRKLYIQTAAGIWQQFDHEVFPVERGGTGLDAVGAGELLFGSGGSVLERLPVPEGEESVLQFAGGKPYWQPREQAAQSIGALRVMTGSYTGNGNDRTIDLPVIPVLLCIYPESGPVEADLNYGEHYYWDNPVFLVNGSTYEGDCFTGINSTSGTKCSISLTTTEVVDEKTETQTEDGETETSEEENKTLKASLKISGDVSGASQGSVRLYNREDEVYHWTAIY